VVCHQEAWAVWEEWTTKDFILVMLNLFQHLKIIKKKILKRVQDDTEKKETSRRKKAVFYRLQKGLIFSVRARMIIGMVARSARIAAV